MRILSVNLDHRTPSAQRGQQPQYLFALLDEDCAQIRRRVVLVQFAGDRLDDSRHASIRSRLLDRVRSDCMRPWGLDLG